MLRLLNDGNEVFVAAARAALGAGLEAAHWLTVDDAGARHGARLWRGEFISPWDRRRQQRQATASAEPPAACVMNGNVERDDGERIYHIPSGQRYYGRARISSEHGERWFCSEEEARAAPPR